MTRGPRGFWNCRWCGKECEARQRTFCSKECVHEWKCLNDVTYQRHLVLERDKGVCCECGRDCVADQERYKTLKWTSYGSVYSDEKLAWVTPTPEQVKEALAAMEEIRAQYGAPPHRTTFWDMDHILPVTEGGGECGLDNLRTLCIPCHRKATKELAARRAAERKKAALEAADPLYRFREDSTT
jgi:5-methylcytosine-specific restriction protein A